MRMERHITTAAPLLPLYGQRDPLVGDSARGDIGNTLMFGEETRVVAAHTTQPTRGRGECDYVTIWIRCASKTRHRS